MVAVGVGKEGRSLLVCEADVGGAEGPAQVGGVHDVPHGEDAPDYGVVEPAKVGVRRRVRMIGGLWRVHSHADVVGDCNKSASRWAWLGLGSSAHRSGVRAVCLRDLSGCREGRGTSSSP